MTALHRPRRATAIGAVTTLLATSLIGAAATTAATAVEPVPPAAIDTVDYLGATYDALGSGHVFETVTFERFEWLLKQEGTFAFHIGGPDDENTNATIGLIDEVAKAYGVDAVYTFNPKLDGGLADVRDPSALPIASTGRAQYAALWTRLVNSYLNVDTTPQFDQGDEAQDPYLFIYDKDRVIGEEADRIIAALDITHTAAELAEAGAADAYQELVADVFDAVSTEVGGQQVADLDTRSQFDFFKGEVNRRHSASYPVAETHGGAILDDADAEGGWRIQSVTYPELEHILQSEGDYVILFGGTWCHNTRAVYKSVNDYAKKNGVTTVYNLDLSLDSTGNAGSNYLHIRDHAVAGGGVNRPAHLYGELVNTYLPNLVTQYDPASPSASNKVTYYPGGDTAQELQTARKLQVPFVIEYDKDRVDGDQPAPVARQWIQRNVNEETSAVTYREYMTEWWYTIGLRGNQQEGGNGHVNAVAFATEAVRRLGVFFGDLPGAPAQTSLSASSVVADGGVTLSAQVAWYGGLAADAEGTVEFFSSTHASLGSATVEDGKAERTVTGLASGGHSAYGVFTPAVGSDYRAATSGAVTFTIPAAPTTPTGPDATPAASTTSIAVSTSKYGKTAKATVTVKNAAGKAVTGKVTLTGAGKSQTKNVVGGKATFALPKTLKVKTYQLKASYVGNAELKASNGAKSFKVTKGAVKKVALKVTKKPTSSKKGKATVTVSSASGLTKATGKVTIKLTKGKSSKTVRTTLSKGKRNITLPKLAKGTWKVTVTYAGNASYGKAKAKTLKVKVAR